MARGCVSLLPSKVTQRFQPCKRSDATATIICFKTLKKISEAVNHTTSKKINGVIQMEKTFTLTCPTDYPWMEPKVTN
ncbi:hypothetical protein MUK42_29785 [Musa troglodytarum]|uniref:Uncharacterized protein n=1 Tax=Musa troglodytarum TaxID=320322 RepID=A0A9E7FKA8_9LILI|nr:hypothetical protein MUK42_29785 [Musa troglodytarum]